MKIKLIVIWLEFVIDIILPAALWPLVRLSLRFGESCCVHFYIKDGCGRNLATSQPKKTET
jgi:hypothetical protein